MIVTVVWSNGKRVYHESLRGKPHDSDMPCHDDCGCNSPIRRAARMANRIIAKRGNNSVFFYHGLVSYGCRCNDRRNYDGMNCHPWHSDGIPPETLAQDIVAPLWIIDTSEVTADDIVNIHNAMRQNMLKANKTMV